MSRLKTAAQKKLEGTARKDRKAITPTALPATRLQAPKGLSAAELAEWNRIAKILEDAHLVNDADRGAVLNYVRAWSLSEYLDKRWKAGDLFYDEQKRKYPLPSMILDAMNKKSAAEAQLGLSPATHGKVTPLGEPAETDPLEQLMREREAHPN